MRYISFGHYHFRLALWTHCQIHQKFWRGSDKCSFFAMPGFWKCLVKPPFPIKLKQFWLYFICFRTSLFLLDDPKNFTKDELGPFFILLFTLVTLFTHLYFIFLSICNVFGSLWFIYLHEAQVYSFWLSMKKLRTMYMAHLHNSSPLYLHS